VTPEPEPMVTDVEGGVPLTYNIAVPVLPVFPAGQITVFSSAEEQALFRRTVERVKWSGYNSSIIMPVARARLSFPDSAEFMKAEFLKRSRPNGTLTLQAGDRCGHFTEQFAAAGAIAELLLQSVGDILRVFPAWPKEQDAKFENLRAQGGFLVSAEQQDGKVTKLQIVSTVGGQLRLLDPWTGKLVERETKSGEIVVLPFPRLRQRREQVGLQGVSRSRRG
jgi:alpha-L-fucosidase 2